MLVFLSRNAVIPYGSLANGMRSFCALIPLPLLLLPPSLLFWPLIGPGMSLSSGLNIVCLPPFLP